MQIPVDDLRVAISAALQLNGATAADAQTQASMLVEGDLRGHHSHGVRRLTVLIGRLKAGLLVSGADPLLDWRTDAVLSVDGGYGFGPVVADVAIAAITERARTTGIALAAVRKAGHLGMLSVYVERIAGGGQIGIALTTSEALVHPWGGASAMVGTNPIGIGVPTSGQPLVLDMSTAAVSAGKILDHAARDLPIPLGWAVDAAGNPTTDARSASAGAVSPFGGPKGYALGLALEALVATVTGTSYGRDVAGTLDVHKPVSKGDVFLVIDLERLGMTGMLPMLTTYLQEVRDSGTDGQPLLVPGDRARAMRADRLAHGIPLPESLWASTQAAARGTTPSTQEKRTR